MISGIFLVSKYDYWVQFLLLNYQQTMLKLKINKGWNNIKEWGSHWL